MTIMLDFCILKTLNAEFLKIHLMVVVLTEIKESNGALSSFILNEVLRGSVSFVRSK